MRNETNFPGSGKGSRLLSAAVLLTAVLLGLLLTKTVFRAVYRPGELSDLPPDVAAFAEANHLDASDYPPKILELLEKNPETREFVLYYPLPHSADHTDDLRSCIPGDGVPLLMQWDRKWGYISYAGEPAGLSACGPLCLSMAGYYLTGDALRFRPDRVMAFASENGYSVPGNGSAWALIGEGARLLGLEVRELPLDEGVLLKNLRAGRPVICIMGPGDFTSSGHFILLTGVQNGKLTVNDPNSRANSRRLWDYGEIRDQILNLWALSAQGKS